MTLFLLIAIYSLTIPIFRCYCMLAANKRLQTLEIGHNNIGNDGISMIIRMLQQNDSLLKLMMQKCGFSSKGNYVARL